MSTLTLWTRRDPFAEFDALLRNAFAPATRTSGFTPVAEVAKDGEDAVVRVELPGLDVEKDVTVELLDGTLVVRGERRDGSTSNGHGPREVRYGTFRRSFTLPKHVTAEAVSASYDAGVLTVRVAGAYTGREPHRIAITTAA
jgi:HSP20 family molecular chaperone IbpA